MHILQSLCALYWSKRTYACTHVPIFAHIQFEILRTQQKRYVRMVCIHTINLKVLHHFDVCTLHTCIHTYTQACYLRACMMHVLALLLSTFHTDIHTICMYVWICKRVCIYIYMYIHLKTSHIHTCWARTCTCWYCYLISEISWHETLHSYLRAANKYISTYIGLHSSSRNFVA